MAFFAMFLVKRTKLTIFLTIWALLMSYSRIYLGVHYPGDLFVGMIIGLIRLRLHTMSSEISQETIQISLNRVV